MPTKVTTGIDGRESNKLSESQAMDPTRSGNMCSSLSMGVSMEHEFLMWL